MPWHKKKTTAVDSPARRKLLLNVAFWGGALLTIGVVWFASRSVTTAALATPPALKPWVYVGGLATMWLAFAATKVFKRIAFFTGEGRRELVFKVIINVTAIAAVAAGFGASILNIPRIDPGLTLLLAMAAVASGALTVRLAVF